MELSHYTNTQGLLGILNNKCLWSTDIRFLNDFRELEIGISNFHDFIKSELVKPSLNNIDKQINKLLEVAKSVIEDNLRNRGIYITSFTSKADNLRQWMSYCPENSGYCIVFDRSELLISGELEQKQSVVARLEDVDYDFGDFSNILCRDSLTKQLSTNPDITNIALEMVNNLMFHCCAIKPNEFNDETESRLIVHAKTTREHEVSYREKSGVIIPYFQYPMELNWIKKIIIGPNSNMDLARTGLKDLISHYKIDCEILESKCSLRQL